MELSLRMMQGMEGDRERERVDRKNWGLARVTCIEGGSWGGTGRTWGLVDRSFRIGIRIRIRI